MKIFTALVVSVSVLCVPVLAVADPETAYQGGKALSNTLAGKKQEKVDDRDAEQRLRDAMREQGKRDGEKLFGTGKSEGKSGGGQQKTDNPRRP